MKTVYPIATLLMFLFVVQAFAQPPGMEKKKEQIRAQKIAYITEEVDLTASEAEKFWLLYRELEEKKSALRKLKHQDIRSQLENVDDLSEEDAKKLIDQIVDIKQQEADLFVEYHAKIQTVLSAQKTAKFYRAEEKFKRELLHRIRENHKKETPK